MGSQIPRASGAGLYQDSARNHEVVMTPASELLPIALRSLLASHNDAPSCKRSSVG